MPTPENPITGFFSWDLIGTYAGAVAATMSIDRILVQMLPPVRMIPPLALGYIIAAVLLILADVFLPPSPTPSSIILCLFNAFGVTLAAIGGQEMLGVKRDPLLPPAVSEPEEESE